MREKDFLYQDLPKNRKEGVIRLLKYRRSLILGILLLLIPFTVPLYVWLMISRYVLVISEIQNNIYLFLIIWIPNLLLGFLYAAGLSGALYLIRRALFMQPINFKHHFFKGIKDSGFEFGFNSLFLMTIISLIDMLVVVSSGTVYYWLTLCIAMIAFILVIMIYSFIFASSSLYIVSLWRALLDGLTYTFKGFWKNIKAICIWIIPFVLLVPNNGNISLILNTVGLLYLAIGGFTISISFISARTYEVFDTAINKIEYPKYYMAGLYSEEKDHA